MSVQNNSTPDIADKAANTPDIADKDTTTSDIAGDAENQPQISDKQKAEVALTYIGLVYCKIKKRMITDAELAQLCADWEIGYKACGMFWASHIVVQLNGWEFRVARQWFADGANLETASDWISFDRIDGGRA
jgi:hypothetical protein